MLKEKEEKPIVVEQAKEKSNQIPLGIGSLVCLRSGSNPMTVTAIDVANDVVQATSFTAQQGYVTLTLPIGSLQPYRAK